MTFNLVVAVPSSGNCKAQFAISLANLVMRFSQQRVYQECEEQSIKFLLQEGTGVPQNREEMVDQFLKTDSTHLLFIDDDMGFNPDTLHVLASRRQPIVGANYRLKSPPCRFMAIRGQYAIPTNESSKGIEQVEYMGFGFCLIERKVFEEIEKPRFLPIYQDGVYSTEDWAFFTKTKYPVYIDHDASKRVWHVGNMLYNWRDDYSNLNKMFKEASL
jgi:hypothetical protein